MDLTKRITQEGKTYGYFVKDGEEEYPILEEALWCETIANSLLESGYKLLSLPYGFVKSDGTPIEEIEEITLEDANLTEMQKVEMQDMLITRMKKATMSTLVSDAAKVGGHSFRKLEVAIKTRDELIKFLKGRKQRESSLDLKDILPINAITSDSALLSPQEWNLAENKELRDLLKVQSSLSYEQYLALVKVFKDLGMSEEYNAKDFIDTYLSFGVPGLRIDNAIIKTEDSDTIFGANYNVSDRWSRNGDSGIPYMRDTVITYIDSSGQVHKTARTSTGNWNFASKKERDELVKKINLQGIEYIAPIKIEAKVMEKVTTIANEEIGVKYNDAFITITINGNVSTDTIITVKEPGSNKALNVKYYNAEKSGLTEHMLCTALSKLLVERLTVKADVSSYKALQAIGASPLAICNYYFNCKDVSEYWSLNPIDGAEENIIEYNTLSREDKKRLERDVKVGPEMSKLVGQYMRGELSDSHPLYATIEYVVTSLIDGGINIDNLQIGASRDAILSSSSHYYGSIYVALKYMGISPKEVFNMIDSVQPTTPSIVFEGNGMKMLLSLAPIKTALVSYENDVEMYKERQLNEASVLGYIDTVYTEYSANRIPGRHAALKYLMLNLKDDKIKAEIDPIVEKLETLYKEIIISSYKQIEPEYNLLMEKIKYMVYIGLFQIAIEGKLGINKVFFKKNVAPGEDKYIYLDMTSDEVPHPIEALDEYINGKAIMTTLRKCLKETVSSTVVLSDVAINYMGKFRTYFINGIVTPEYVVPRAGYTLKEVSFKGAAMEFLPEIKDKMIDLFATNKLLPEREIEKMRAGTYKSLKYLYRDSHYPMGSEKPLTSFAGNLLTYDEEATKEIANANNTKAEMFNRPVHPFEATYPTLVDILDNDEYKDNVNGDNSKGKYYYKATPYQEITQETIFSRNPRLAYLGKAKVEQKAIAKKFEIKDLSVLPAEALVANTENALQLLDNIEGKPLLFAVEVNGDLVFGKGDVVQAEEIEKAYQTGKYKIRRLNARIYIVQMYNGLFKEVDLY